MHTALESLVHALEQAPDTPSHAIEVLPPHEKLLLQAWNRTETDLPSDGTIITLFEAVAARHAQQVALVFEDDELTYAQLNVRANRLAHYLVEQGVHADELVAICVQRSPEMIVAVLAVLKAGGAYLPLDPALPAARMAYMFNDAQPRLLLTQSHLNITQNATPTVFLDRDAEKFSGFPEHNPPQRAWPEHLAYAIYTSGSTGNPKGTLIQQGALVNLALAQREALGLQPGLRVLQWASFNFDASVQDIFPTLCAGAQLCLASREAVLPGQNLFETLRRQRIELIALTPSSLAALPVEMLPDLKTVVVGGERCEHALIAPWLKRYRVINVYGPTEATVCATIYPCRQDGERHPAIGRPIANTQVYILDAWLNPVPFGVVGELYIGGEGLARGYLGRPDLTAERFTQNPFSEQPGARMYKTGDLARYLPDGQIEYVGRADHQVKIRGFRIELGEIEFTLGSLPGVREAVVLAQQAIGGPRLIACVAAEAGVDAPTLRKALAQKLPEYMVPAHFIFLDKLPINTSGKIDRKALEALEPAAVETAAQAAPRSALEQRLAHLWAELLGRSSIGRDENFFDAGGNSLLAVRLVARINAEWACSLPVS
ncbi:MAG TPA: non-ribosomal peptide synthetase, partial [Noviherbaspirillum sp.]